MPTKTKEAVCLTLDREIVQWLLEVKERQKAKSLSAVVNQILWTYKELVEKPAR